MKLAVTVGALFYLCVGWFAMSQGHDATGLVLMTLAGLMAVALACWREEL